MKSILKKQNTNTSNQQITTPPRKKSDSQKRPQAANSGGRKDKKFSQNDSKTTFDQHQNQVNNVNYESEGEGDYPISLKNQNSSKDNQQATGQSRGRAGSKVNSTGGSANQTMNQGSSGTRTINVNDRQRGSQKQQRRGTDSDKARSLPRNRGQQDGNQTNEVKSTTRSISKGRAESLKNIQASMDVGAGISVFVGQDLFQHYESSHIVNRFEEEIGEIATKYDIINQIYHAKQTFSSKQSDLLVAKRESRALRRAKQTQVKKGKFQDAFCTKALEDTEKILVDEMISTQLGQAILVHLQDLEQYNSNRQSYSSSQPRIETPEKNTISQKESIEAKAAQFEPSHKDEPIEIKNQREVIPEPQPLQSQQTHEVMSGNSLNMFGNEQDLTGNFADIGKKETRNYENYDHYGSPLQESEGKQRYVTESINQRTYYHPSSYQLQQVKAAAVAACQAATLHNFYKVPGQQQQLHLKSYLPRDLKDNLQTGVNSAGPRQVRQRRVYDNNAQSAGYLMHPLSAQSRKMKRTQRAPMQKYQRQQQYNKYGYTNADLDNIQDQIRQQVEYQKLLKQQNQMRVDEERALTEPADIINIESVDSPQGVARPKQNLEQAAIMNQDQTEQTFGDNRDNKQGGIIYSASKQKFNIQGPILKQSKIDKRSNRHFKTNQKYKNRDGSSRHKRQYLGVTDGGQYQDRTSEGRAALSINNGATNELVSSFDMNDQSEFNQVSILAMSQGNIWTQSGHESYKSQNRNRGRSENPGGNRMIKLNKQIQNKDGASRGMSGNKAPRSTSMNSKNSKKSGGSSQLRDQHGKIQARFQEKDQESSNLYLRSFNAERQIKLKLKRAQTEKEQPADRVIEEGSDDDSFASDTPSRVKRTKNKDHQMDDFDQTMNRLQRSPEGRQNLQKSNKDGISEQENMSSKNMAYNGSHKQIGTKKMTGSLNGSIRGQGQTRGQNLYQERQSNQGTDQGVNINRVIYNKNLQLNRGAKQRGTNNPTRVLPGISDGQQKNYPQIRRKKNQPRINEQYYNEFDGDTYKQESKAPTGKPTNTQRTPQKMLQRDFQENSPPVAKQRPNAELPATNQSVNDEPNLQEKAQSSPESTGKENVAQQLRNKVQNSRKTQNTWISGGQYKQLNNYSNNSSRYFQPLQGNFDDKYNAKKVALNLIRPNPSFIQGMLLGGSRGSMPANQAGKKYNKIQMNVDRSKFQKIARPYIMSANSVKANGVNCMKSSIGPPFMPLTASSQISSLTVNQKNQIMAAQGLINKTLSTGSMLGPSSNYNQYVTGYQPYQTAYSNTSASLQHQREPSMTRQSQGGHPYSGRRDNGQRSGAGQATMQPDGHTIIASQEEDEEAGLQPAVQARLERQYAQGGVTSEPQFSSLKQNLFPASPRQSSNALSTKQQTNSRRLGTANNHQGKYDGGDSLQNTINMDGQTSEGMTAYGYATGLPNLHGSNTQADMLGVQRQSQGFVQNSQKMLANRPKSNNTQDAQFDQMRRQPQILRNTGNQFNDTENGELLYTDGRSHPLRGEIAPQKVRTAQGQRRKYNNMANSNAVNLRPSYKSNTLGARKQLPRVPNAARKSKFVTANAKTSTSVSSNVFKQMRGDGNDQITHQVNDGTNGSVDDDMILAVNEQPNQPNTAEPGPRRLQAQMYSS